MYAIEHLHRDQYLPLVNDGYNATHTYRGHINMDEYDLRKSWREYVYYQCNNILCKHEWPIYKKDALDDQDKFIKSLHCPTCNSFSVMARWVYYERRPMKELLKNNYFLYDVILDERRLVGSIYNFKKTSTLLYSAIYHIHKQYPTI